MSGTEGQAAPPAVAAGSAPVLPVLYRRPRPLEAGRDAGKSLLRNTGFGFARDVNSVPVVLSELLAVARSYPIVFTAREPWSAVAVLGLRERRNLFVDANGQWRPDAYIPAYIRRYPFVFMHRAGRPDLLLGIDEASELLIDDDTQPLFVAGKPGPAIETALNFCREFETQHQATRALVRALAEQGLLVQKEAQLATDAGREVALAGFTVIDEARLAALPDAVFLDWRRRGWLKPIHWHLMSMDNWPRLLEIAGGRRPA